MKRIHQIFLFVFLVVMSSCSSDRALDINTNDNPKGEVTSGKTFLSKKEAAEVAQKFIIANDLLGPVTKSSDLSLAAPVTDLELDDIKTKSSSSQPAFYVFNLQNVNAYVIVSAEKTTSSPVIAFSDTSKFDAKNVAPGYASMLGQFKSEILELRVSGTEVSDAISLMRDEYLDEELVKTKGRYDNSTNELKSSVRPLLGGIKWSQRPYYNRYCPANAPVGCVATATTMIMRHYEYPARGKGTSSYRSRYGVLSHNYNYDLDWSKMPKAKLRGHNNLVAKFSYGVAVALEMQFAPSASGAWQYNVPKILKKHYGYPNSVKSVNRSRYTDRQWAAALTRELSAGRPVQYAGYGGGGGHSFVCDGYRDSRFFHFNWGWGGMSNNYCLLRSLNPGTLGTGGGTGGFNKKHSAVFNFAPPKSDPTPDPTPTPPTPPTPAVPNYCSPKSVYNYYLNIAYVKIGNMKYCSPENTRAKDLGASPTANVTEGRAGQNLRYAIEPGFAEETYYMYTRVFIDYNKDGHYNHEDEIASEFNRDGRTTGTLKLPRNLTPGTYGVRISMKYGSYPTSCESFEHGEIKDFQLVIR